MSHPHPTALMQVQEMSYRALVNELFEWDSFNLTRLAFAVRLAGSMQVDLSQLDSLRDPE